VKIDMDIYKTATRRWLVALLFFTVLALLSILLISCSVPPKRDSNNPPNNPVKAGQAGGDNSTATPYQPGEGTSPTPAEPGLAVSTPTLSLPSPDPWDGKSRVTILVMGLDYGDWQSEDRVGPPRTDSMMLLTIDPTSRTAGMLSIPRDLWVSIPGFEGFHKINTAHRYGELYKMPGGGPFLAVRTVEGLLEIPINYYVRINFYGFVDFIDELGGIEVDVPQEISVDPIGPGNTIQLTPGRQHLDGSTALAYARNRYTSDGDFDRARRQQQVILAIRDRVMSLDMLPTLVFKAPQLYRALSQGMQTNLILEQVIRLAWFAREIPAESIHSAVIGRNEVIYGKAPDGQAMFQPIPERIHALRNEIFSSSDPNATDGMTTPELIAAENTRISLINETGEKALGKRTADYLEGLGMNITQVEMGDQTRAKTRLVDQVGDPYTLRYLINHLHVQPSEIYVQYNPDTGVDLVIYLGEDWASDNPLP